MSMKTLESISDYRYLEYDLLPVELTVFQVCHSDQRNENLSHETIFLVPEFVDCFSHHHKLTSATATACAVIYRICEL